MSKIFYDQITNDRIELISQLKNNVKKNDSK